MPSKSQSSWKLDRVLYPACLFLNQNKDNLFQPFKSTIISQGVIFRQYFCFYILEVDMTSPFVIFLTYKLFSWIQFSKSYNREFIFPNSLKHVTNTHFYSMVQVWSLCGLSSKENNTPDIFYFFSLQFEKWIDFFSFIFACLSKGLELFFSVFFPSDSIFSWWNSPPPIHNVLFWFTSSSIFSTIMWARARTEYF